MRLVRLLLVFIVFSPLVALSQGRKSAAEFKAFLSHFEKANLPLCEDYEGYKELSDSTPIYRRMTLKGDTEIAEENDTIVSYMMEPRGIAPKNSAAMLPSKYYDSFLKSELDATFRSLYYIDSTTEYLVFPLNRLVADSFVAVTVEIQFRARFSVESKKYFVTLDNDGRLVDLLEIAAYAFGGSSVDDHDNRIPWFYTMLGCVDKDWKLILHDNNYSSPVKWYQVSGGGIIMDLK